MVSSNVSNVKIIASSVGWALAIAGLAILSFSSLFISADITMSAKQAVIHMGTMVSTGSIEPFLTSISGFGITFQGFLLVLVAFMIGLIVRMFGLGISSNKFISSVENLFYGSSVTVKQEPVQKTDVYEDDSDDEILDGQNLDD